MPELPEVEVAARNLGRWTKGRRIRAVHAGAHADRVFRPAAPTALRALAGARVRDLRRVGKNLLITLDAARGGALGAWSHLGLTGKWVRRDAGDAAPKNSRLDLELDDGAHLHYVDPRMFGRFRLVPGARFDELPEIRALGPDPLTDGIDAAALHARLARTRLPIKVAIMDQALLPGVGNIQASESLFRARIDPRRPARSLSRAEVGRLARAIRASIDFTLSTFADTGADGGGADIVYVEERRTSNPFLVYGRAGEPCPRANKRVKKRGRGHATITRIVQAQRSTFFCGDCQR
jgi:formamidopyrimidine-DNA glycosylase